ncbi:sialidase family protein [Dactylosporangium sp. CS-047395]|uniref:sialidase family protein n=1 Tax=Dactylosporangium sp. CS-047395 TaxID=3239936 RepID=UPI003D938602
MPDQLESRLRAERDRLDIDQPPMEVIAARAAALRRRRLAARTGIASLATLAVIGAAVATVDRPSTPAPMIAASDPAATWSAGGITIAGLDHLPADLPGAVRDVEFLDAERGYLLSTDCCTTWVSTTDDGGRTWRTVESPVPGQPRMVVTAAGVTLFGEDHRTRATSADGEHWTAGGNKLDPDNALTGDARMVQLGNSECGSATAGLAGTRLAPLPQQPPISVCWRSPVRAGDGAWWVAGGDWNGLAVAVSRDDGQSWTTTHFPGYDAATRPRMAMLGRTVFLAIAAPQEAAGAPDRLLAVAVSTDGGATFGPPRPTAGNATIGGDLVPLLDGRLLIVDGYGHWLVSEDSGTSWVRLEGLHLTMRLARTEGGYVAYQMTTIYTAFSADGADWQKLDAQ